MERNWTRVLALASVAVAAVVPSVTEAATVTYKEGAPTPFVGGAYLGAQDNTLILQGGNTYDNWGGRQYMQVGLSAPNAREPMLRFNVGSLAGQYLSIDAVQLRLYVCSAPAAGEPDVIEIHRVADVNADWVEGTYGGGAQTGSSCWGWKHYATEGWAGSMGAGTEGVDYEARAIATQTISSANVVNSSVTFNFIDVSFISDWIAGPNAGLILQGTDPDPKTVWPAFWSREASSLGGAGYEPELIVTYTPIPEPASAALLILAALGVISRRRHA